MVRISMALATRNDKRGAALLGILLPVGDGGQ